ncbi:MAG: hypothetical protein RMY64_17350 [Nostoc sp. DedQUE08]|uniref:hypothetical protein n=1 Tax=Nostoc sp. DedQUE08 TaxID=3075393 RepID=UPI002AD35195|nr:hypothetical protein [Nostoc sp. DedQUE08]MDZ8067363.1 hypothetical protein [Nostoc sp. DedQUE08]
MSHRLSTHSDSQIVLHLDEKFSIECLQHLRGEFAFILWHEARQVLFNVSSMNLSRTTSLSHGEREEQREIRVLAPLSVSERGWGRGQKRACRTHVIYCLRSLQY